MIGKKNSLKQKSFDEKLELFPWLCLWYTIYT